MHHLAVVEIEHRDAAIDALAAARIGWGIHYPVPCHRQPAFADAQPPPSLPVADAAAERILSLPCSPSTTTEQVERVAATLTDHLRHPTPLR